MQMIEKMTSKRRLCCSCCSKCQRKWDSVIENAFGKLGFFISTYPVIIMIVCIVVNLLLTIGIVNIEVENDVETLYTPMDSQAIKDRSALRNLYGDSTNSSFRPYQLSDFGLYGDVMIISKNKSTIMNQAYVDEINNINSIIRNTISVSDSTGQTYTYDDLRAGSNSNEGIASAVVLMDTFQKKFIIANITYPFDGDHILSPYLAQASHETGKLNSALGVKLQYYLRQSDVNAVELSKQWEKAFVSKLESLQTNLTDIAFAYSDSLGTELNKNTKSDIGFFSVTFVLMMTYASLASFTINCNNVANRMNLGIAGVIAPLLAIASSCGFVSAIGIQFTNIVGVMPFLVIGIGIDDMFILMSGIADAQPLSKISIEERVIFMMQKSAVAISITSLTDLLAFVVGATSVFKSIRNFCIYTGTNLLLFTI
ncbi:patched domain-containing protein 3-like isoform X2 [Ostrea edulis]|uniref:patched domain-containing protein 3-like isoform X2 n=1 Tax=Ostrea edulis TaxID=37623 RepID=UPI0024AF7C2E|nr:patched domain-containing protein 3-like isoform X2 [Ostrea edulis]